MPPRWSPAVVMTVALGGGCSKSGASAEPGQGQGQGQTKTTDHGWYQSEEENQKNEDGSCTRYVSVSCPEEVDCNPPAPEKVRCPKGM